MSNRYDFTGRSAVVTGGAQGIGRRVAEIIVAGGGRIALWDRDRSLLAKAAAELGAEAIAVDVADAAAVEAATAETLRRLGRIDILVNSAGITGPNVALADYPVAEWDRVIAINLRGSFLTCRAVLPGMVGQNYGRIANVASIAGKEGNPNASAYSASKAGLIALTKSLAKETAAQDISVNAVAPAAVRTAIFDQMNEQHISYMLARIPRGRFAEVDEVAATIAFMVSEDCSFTTGFTFDVSGGRATY
ncbi:MAG TPA: SDR family NAD(P)-dependent oxidoreductase [Bauldia sp.]|nr:SDR family NAD(P)-dependent oxidoreductase [Bauldia sp.]